MRQALTRLIPFLAAATLALGAVAQEPKEDPIKQLKLTEAQVKSFISAQPDLATVAPKLQEAGDNIQPTLQTELDTIAKKHGFASFQELDDVAANISIARNACLEHSRGELLVFIDDDETATPEWLASLVAKMDESGADVVLGPVKAIYGTPTPKHSGHTGDGPCSGSKPNPPSQLGSGLRAFVAASHAASNSAGSFHWYACPTPWQ